MANEVGDEALNDEGQGPLYITIKLSHVSVLPNI